MNKKCYHANLILLAVLAVFAASFFISPFRSYPKKTQKKFSNTAFGKMSVISSSSPVLDNSFAEFDHVKISLFIADTPELRTQGLSGAESLPEHTGMLFLFDKPDILTFWMKDMRFSLDMIWIRGGRVEEVTANVQPEPGVPDQNLNIYSPREPADRVLEVPAGFAEAAHIVSGSFVYIAAHGNELSDPLPVPAKDAGSEFFIETLAREPHTGNDFKIKRLLEQNDAYKKYLISYRSDGIKISGVMNIPEGAVPRHGFPLLILNHGLIRKEIYFPGRGSKREQDFFPRHGYVTIHPDYRGLGESEANPSSHHDFYVGYSRDVAHLVDAVKQAKLDFIDTNRIGMWGHSMGGGITARVMLMRPEIRAFVLFAPISADAEDNFYELTEDEIDWLHRTYGPAGAEVYRKISPITYFKNVTSPVQLHHGLLDKDVPIDFSEKMFSALIQNGKRAEFFTYPGEKHEFINDWPLAAGRALQFFDMYVKK